MMIRDFKELAAAAENMTAKSRLALCCAEDEHALEAVAAAVRRGMIDAVLIGQTDMIEKILGDLHEDPANYRIIAADGPEEAVRIAADMVRDGEADIIMKGKMQTSDLMRNVLKKENDLRDSAVLSVCGNFVLKQYPEGYEPRIISVTDPALNVHPTLEQKEAILKNALRLRKAMGESDTRVAVIAANEQVSPKIPETVEADALKQMNIRGELEGCTVEGPISLDLALFPSAAAVKSYESPVAGNADLLLMPDLISANILAKSITELAGGETAGIVLGAKVPIVLVSRASAASDKFNSIALAAYVAPKYRKA